MSDDNGSKAQVEKDAIAVELYSGVTVYVVPLPPFARSAIKIKVEQEYLYPDGDEYRLPMPNSAIENATLRPEQNPEYQKLCAAIDTKRGERRVWLEIMAAIVHTEPERDALINFYRDDVERWRDLIDVYADEWLATLQCGILNVSTDLEAVQMAFNGQAELTMGEVVDAMPFFRIKLSRHSSRALANKRAREFQYRLHQSQLEQQGSGDGEDVGQQPN